MDKAKHKISSQKHMYPAHYRPFRVVGGAERALDLLNTLWYVGVEVKEHLPLMSLPTPLHPNFIKKHNTGLAG